MGTGRLCAPDPNAFELDPMAKSKSTKRKAHPSEALEARIQPLREKLLQHPLYDRLQSLEDVQRFMELHVYAVWDFMSLIKYLQVRLTCLSLPWVPISPPGVRRLVNEIVLGEESDIGPDGKPISHYELYLDAMREAGANHRPAQTLVSALYSASTLDMALQVADIPPPGETFIHHTFMLIDRDMPHEVAAAFLYGREALLPDLFLNLVRELEQLRPGPLSKFQYYLQRHIELDGGQHSLLARELLDTLCEDEDYRWEDAEAAAQTTLRQRLELWDAILDRVEGRHLDQP